MSEPETGSGAATRQLQNGAHTSQLISERLWSSPERAHQPPVQTGEEEDQGALPLAA